MESGLDRGGSGNRPPLPSPQPTRRIPAAGRHQRSARRRRDNRADWPQIVALYDQLLALAPTPVVALNRAIAIGELQGPAAALALVDELDLDNYHPFHATRADLLRRLGRNSEAAIAYERAAAIAPTDAERDFLRLGGRASR